MDIWVIVIEEGLILNPKQLVANPNPKQLVANLTLNIWLMAEYDASQFHPCSLRCVLSLNNKQAQTVCMLYSLLGKTKVKQHLAIVDHFFETPNLKSE
jgi:hypothetical protein